MERSDARVNLSPPSATSSVTAAATDADGDWARQRRPRPPRPRHAHRPRRKAPGRAAAAPAAAPLHYHPHTAATPAGGGGGGGGGSGGDGADSPSSAVMPSSRRVSVSISHTDVDDEYDGDTSDWLTDYSATTEAPSQRYTAVLEQLVKVDSCQACKGPVDATGAAHHVAVEVGKVDGKPEGGGGRGLGAGMTEEEKAEKKRKAKVKDYMKTALSSERTFFKWMFAGLQFGALGTLLFVSFRDDGGFPVRLLLVFGCWGLGLAASCYGLLQYHRRRAALTADDPDPGRWESPRAPAVLVAAFFLVVLTVLSYAIATRQHQPPPPWAPPPLRGNGR